MNKTRSGHLLELKNKGEVQLGNPRSQSRGTQREYSSKPLKHCIVERIVVFKR